MNAKKISRGVPYTMLKSAILIFLGIGIAISCSAEERFQSGEFKGLTKSPTEQVIVRINEPITVSSVHGRVPFNDGDTPLEEVIFEIRGPGNQVRIRATKSDSSGRFNISRVPEGSYTFKSTKDGFQSVVGMIIVSKKADKQKSIEIKMLSGV